MGKWKCKCNPKRNWPCKSKKAKTVEKEGTENELWLEIYAPFLHFLPFEEICSRMETSPTEGMTSDVAKMKLQRNGKNVLPKLPALLLLHWRYLFQCFSVMGVLILLCSIVCFSLYIHDYVTKTDELSRPEFLVAGAILLIFFFLSGLMVILHEEDNEEIHAAIEELMPMYCTVIRDGKKQIILSKEVVIGDIVPISYGQRLPADLRFFSTSGLEVDNVALTGASEPWQIVPLADDIPENIPSSPEEVSESPESSTEESQ